MLDLINLRKTFNPNTINQKVALDGVSLHLDDGDFVTMIGGNGAGKSTLLNAIAGVWPLDDGKVIIDGMDISGLSEHLRAPWLGRVFQDPMMGTAATMQIIENLALAKRRGQKRGLRPGVTKPEKEEYRALLATLGLGLEDRLTSKVGVLSGGQRQALTLLMATLNKPKLLLLDEHTAALDPRTAEKASPDSHFAFLHFFSMGIVLIPVSCTMSRTSIHSSSGTLSIRSSPLRGTCLR